MESKYQKFVERPKHTKFTDFHSFTHSPSHSSTRSPPLSPSSLPSRSPTHSPTRSPSSSPTLSPRTTHSFADTFASFKLTRVLNIDTRKKVSAFLGTMPKPIDGNLDSIEVENVEKVKKVDTIIVIKTDALDENDLGLIGDIQLDIQNDVYYQATAFNPSRIRMTVICPCTEKHISKFSKKTIEMMSETFEQYTSIVRPFAISDNVTWIENIFNGKKEQDRIWGRGENDSFLILPDTKWNGKIQDLYLLVLTKERILCLRELRDTHLPLLKAIRLEITRLVISLNGPKVRCYIHYLPTYFHFHIHVASVTLDEIGCSHLLDDVINNLELYPDFYTKKTLFFPIATSHVLYPLLKN